MGEMTQSWALLLGLGAFHGINPGMGWLFAVALGMQERRRSAVLAALLPLGIGHALAVVAAIAVALLAPDGRQMKGNLAQAPAVQSMQEGYHSAVIRLRGQPSPHQAELVLARLPDGQWLVSGRLVGEGLAFRAT